MSRQRATRQINRRLTPIILVLLTLLGAELLAAASASARRPGSRPTASLPVQFFDANIRYTSGGAASLTLDQANAGSRRRRAT